MLRGHISAFLLPVCDSTFTAEFIAEALISWSMEKLDFEKMYLLLEKIIKNNISKGEIENEQL
jgi:hypothetical protein